jgi:hypothetical protein
VTVHLERAHQRLTPFRTPGVGNSSDSTFPLTWQRVVLSSSRHPRKTSGPADCAREWVSVKRVLGDLADEPMRIHVDGFPDRWRQSHRREIMPNDKSGILITRRSAWHPLAITWPKHPLDRYKECWT